MQKIRMRALKNVGRYRVGDEFVEGSSVDARILELLKVAERVEEKEKRKKKERRTYRRRDMVAEETARVEAAGVTDAPVPTKKEEPSSPPPPPPHPTPSAHVGEGAATATITAPTAPSDKPPRKRFTSAADRK